jgi:hypothetical protein
MPVPTSIVNSEGLCGVDPLVDPEPEGDGYLSGDPQPRSPRSERGSPARRQRREEEDFIMPWGETGEGIRGFPDPPPSPGRLHRHLLANYDPSWPTVEPTRESPDRANAYTQWLTMVHVERRQHNIEIRQLRIEKMLQEMLRMFANRT